MNVCQVADRVWRGESHDTGIDAQTFAQRTAEFGLSKVRLNITLHWYLSCVRSRGAFC
jgi:hypothetical protein